MGILESFFGVFLKQLFGGVLDWLKQMRMESALKQLGVETTERQYAQAALDAERTARQIVDESRALGGDALVDRLRGMARPDGGHGPSEPTAGSAG